MRSLLPQPSNWMTGASGRIGSAAAQMKPRHARTDRNTGLGHSVSRHLRDCTPAAPIGCSKLSPSNQQDLAKQTADASRAACFRASPTLGRQGHFYGVLGRPRPYLAGALQSGRRTGARNGQFRVYGKRKLDISGKRRSDSSGMSLFPLARCRGVEHGAAVRNWLGAANAKSLAAPTRLPQPRRDYTLTAASGGTNASSNEKFPVRIDMHSFQGGTSESASRARGRFRRQSSANGA